MYHRGGTRKIAVCIVAPYIKQTFSLSFRGRHFNPSTITHFWRAQCYICCVFLCSARSEHREIGICLGSVRATSFTCFNSKQVLALLLYCEQLQDRLLLRSMAASLCRCNGTAHFWSRTCSLWLQVTKKKYIFVVVVTTNDCRVARKGKFLGNCEKFSRIRVERIDF